MPMPSETRGRIVERLDDLIRAVVRRVPGRGNLEDPRLLRGLRPQASSVSGHFTVGLLTRLPAIHASRSSGNHSKSGSMS